VKRGPHITRAMEDYLKAMVELGEADIKPRALAHRLGVAAASVTGMLGKLASLKLVAYQKYRGATLTPAGRALALEIVRHHRLLETYLAEALGYPWHEVHAEAERLEHVISEAFEARVDALLGHPTHDPHGDPIPQRDGSLPPTPGVPLAHIAAPARVRITRVTNQDPTLLQRIAEQRLIPGTTAALQPRGTGDPSIRLTLLDDGSTAVVHIDIADVIHAEVIAAAPHPQGG